MASQGTEAALFGLFRPYILAKFTLGALDKPLFRQFHDGVLRSSVLSWYSDVLCALEHIHLPHTGVCCVRCVASGGRVKAQDSYLSSS